MLAEALDEAIERSAAPAAVALVVERLYEERRDVVDRLEDDPELRAAVVAVTAASRSLTQVVLVDDSAIDVLAALDRRPPPPEGGPDELVRWKRLELLRVAARDLLGVDDLEQTGLLLADLAGDVLHGAWRMADERPDRLAVIGMGKQGGRELNYASDVDVMFVGDGEREARQLMDIARRCFRVDANLRPEGRDGPLVRSVESYEAYWQRWAEPWEFQALLKARHTAGDATIGAAFDEAAARHLWGRAFSADDLRSLRAMKARAEAEVARKGLSDREVKRGRGGLRDIEFAVQLLQLVHGRHDGELRSPTTLVALTELAAAGYVEHEDASALADAYRFLRTVEHRLQLVDEQQVHAVPTDHDARMRLARVVGFRDTPEATAAEQLDDELRRHQATVRSIHERVYFRPLLEAFSVSGGAMSPAAAEERLAAFGFTEADRTRQAVRELTRGLSRSSRLMQQMLPLLLGWLADTPDPDLGLLGLRTLVSGPQRSTELANAFRDSPEVARRLCCLLGTSRILTDGLVHNPDLIAPLGAPDGGGPRTGERLLEGARAALGWRPDVDARARALRRFKDREMLQVAARDVLGMTAVEETGRELSGLAEATLQAALEALAPTMPFAVVAMGRFGGGELSYASDLDVVFVYDGGTPADFEEAERLATALLRFVAGATPATRIYDLDADLRPEGRQGPLARSLEGYRIYFERWAEVWERQAMVRARPVAGDQALGTGFLDAVRPLVWRELSGDDVREIRRIKARVERERIPAGEDPQFHLKLGRGSLSDVEWTVQLLQLRHGVRGAGTMETLPRLVERGALSVDDAAVLGDSYRFCERARNRWFLVKGGQGDSLPRQDRQLGRLARSLDTTPGALREDYRRVTRRARQVVERLFYERPQ